LGSSSTQVQSGPPLTDTSVTVPSSVPSSQQRDLGEMDVVGADSAMVPNGEVAEKIRLCLIQDQEHALVLLSAPPSQSQVRRSIRLKVKGLNGGTSKYRSQPHSGSPLMVLFPFCRFTTAEIVDLFHYFRVQLGFNELQRVQMIISFRIIKKN
jgi:hypothetical protein